MRLGVVSALSVQLHTSPLASPSFRSPRASDASRRHGMGSQGLTSFPPRNQRCRTDEGAVERGQTHPLGDLPPPPPRPFKSPHPPPRGGADSTQRCRVWWLCVGTQGVRWLSRTTGGVARWRRAMVLDVTQLETKIICEGGGAFTVVWREPRGPFTYCQVPRVAF